MIQKHSHTPKDSHRKILRLTLLGLIPTLLFVWIAIYVGQQKTLFFDTGVALFIQSVSTPWLDTIVKLMTHLGDKVLIFLITAIILAVLYFRRQYTALFMTATIVGGAAVLNVLLKAVFARARPDVLLALITEDGFSFPSGHAMGATAFALAIVALAYCLQWPRRRTVVLIAVGYALLIGLSRIYLGVHYPSDVIAGICVSVGWGVLVYVLFRHCNLVARFQSKFHVARE